MFDKYLFTYTYNCRCACYLIQNRLTLQLLVNLKNKSNPLIYLVYLVNGTINHV